MRAAVIAAIIASATIASAQSAKEYYAEGARHYEAGEYDEAIVAFDHAYAQQKQPSLLYNMALAFRKRGPGNCGYALKLYKQYLREAPNAKDREHVEKLASAIEECASSEKPAPDPRLKPLPEPEKPAPAPPPPPAQSAPAPAPPPPPARSRAPWFVVGFGAAALISGGVMQGLARAKFNDLKTQCPCPESTWQDWRTVELTSYGLLAGGALAVTIGLVWHWAGGSSETQASVVPLPGGAAVAVAGGF